MKVFQSGTFKKRGRALGKPEKKILDNQIRKFLENAAFGQEKTGELKGAFIHKFKIHTTQYLLAYRIVDRDLELIMIGPHENYYRDLSNYLKAR